MGRILPIETDAGKDGRPRPPPRSADAAGALEAGLSDYGLKPMRAQRMSSSVRRERAFSWEARVARWERTPDRQNGPTASAGGRIDPCFMAEGA